MQPVERLAVVPFLARPPAAGMTVQADTDRGARIRNADAPGPVATQARFLPVGAPAKRAAKYRTFQLGRIHDYMHPAAQDEREDMRAAVSAARDIGPPPHAALAILLVPGHRSSTHSTRP